MTVAGDRPSRWVRTSAAVLVAVVFALPGVFLVLGSLRLPGLPPPDGIEVVPDPIWRGNFRAAIDLVGLDRSMRNSLLVAIVVVPGTVLVGSLAGFAIATSGPRTRPRLVGVTVAALLVPAVGLWVPRVVILSRIGLTDSLASLMTPALVATSPLYVLLFALAYARIPSALYDAAALEGLSPLATWRRVALPLAKPAAGAVAALAFAASWSNLTDALLYLPRQRQPTVAIGLRTLQTLEPTNLPLLLAGATLASVPPVLAFLFAQRALLATVVEG